MNDEKPAPGTGVQFFEVDSEYEGQRVDNFLLSRLKGLPKSRLYKLLRKGELRVNKRRTKPDYKLVAGDLIRVPPMRLAERGEVALAGEGLKARLAESILYEDNGILIVNKPSGLAVHGGSGVSLGLIEALRQMRPEAKFLELAHRLDRDTSGCIIVAKRRSALRALHELFRGVGMDKRYLALAAGEWPQRRSTVSVALKKNELKSGERVVRPAADGKESLTRFSIVRRLKGATLIEAKPVTGRTHQIRVHAQYAGHPLVGDDKYGDEAVDKKMRELGSKRLFLHAWRLNFELSGKRVQVEAKLPEELSKLVDRLNKDER
ncbi:Ribosomal large subunit pseudouridine synthase C [Sinobacterium norvegicum]|uniref:Pseudouridine synthase n=1 Tax=Sinobacterium norvegicum TaxID=1641715 RepID=A0ABM9AAU9_9GAMM|nr:23S rRNA pseudouridine(955/2504/2580) synthase RluC [Sinobacterium norvegicum]CAH0990115.1 Ribosomal large subunit pseudouridine synthase C [Sinobacterium norvegicum]